MVSGGGFIYISLEVLIAVGCCLGNMLVIWAVWRSGALNKPTFCLIVSLAVADFLVGAVAIPLAVTVDIHIKIPFHACLFISCFLIVPLQASVLTLLAIAVDRCLRVCIPFRYKSTVTKKRSWFLAAMCWILASVLGFLPMFGWYNNDALTRYNSTSIDCQFIVVIPITYLIHFIFEGCFLPPLAAMIALYCYIFLKIRSGRAGMSAETSTYKQKEHKLATSLVLVLALFIVCWLPLHTIQSITYYNQSIHVPPIALYFGILLSHANSMVNPVVYAFKIPKIKREYGKIWRRVIGQQQQADTNSSRTPASNTTDNHDGRVHVKISPQGGANDMTDSILHGSASRAPQNTTVKV
ncbi:adenosine receptor A3 [Sinocyclocheilus anshuiensis]|uniref:adenosine receptor A3 n=1 Tax=Sinocyclocheilus anshuiensis TaxID=1608454 RepID=UPI0007B86B9B|nr:PREDICTED: adenosine receptor A3-like [Sinocyclocheilus anshuiensis]